MAGLGNPGSKYDHTRHNIGFMVVDRIAEENSLIFSESKWQAQAVNASIYSKHVFLVKPQTYMNESGRSIGGIADYYRIDSANIVVVHDDLDLDLGQVKIVVSRGAGGHKGITSTISHLGSNDFIRVRFGIGRPESAMPVNKFVLSKFTQPERELVDEKISQVIKQIELIISEGVVKAMNLANRKK